MSLTQKVFYQIEFILLYKMLSLLKNNPLSPIFRCEELKKVVVEIKTGKNIYKIAYKKLLAPKQDLDQD